MAGGLSRIASDVRTDLSELEAAAAGGAAQCREHCRASSRPLPDDPTCATRSHEYARDLEESLRPTNAELRDASKRDHPPDDTIL